MYAMPTPTAWGELLMPAKTDNGFRLEKGNIAFVVLPLRIFPNRPILPPDREDNVIGKLDEDTRRPILPVVEQPPQSAPRRHRRTPVKEEIVDYKNPGDSDVIRDELFDQLHTLTFRVFAEGFAVIFLGLIELLPMFGVRLPDMFLPDKAPALYLMFNLLLGGFCIVLCRRVYAGGFESIIKLKPDGEGMLTIACTAVMVDILAELVSFFVTRAPVHRVCAAPMAMALLVNDIGLLIMTRRVARNFRFVALRKMSMAANIIENDIEFDEIIHADHQSRYNVAYSVRTKFLENYLRYSYEEDFCEQLCSRITPYVIFVALAAGLFGGFASFEASGVWGGLYCLCAVLVAGVPICRILCLNIPMSLTCRRLLQRGAMLNGWVGADKFGSTDTLAVSSDMLFPRGTVKLLSAKAFGEAPLGRSMLYAASVILAAGGPLAQVFEDMLEGHYDQLLPAEGIDYENEMGVSGFVDSRPVLVGNRKMLELHGCYMPSRDYEHIITGGELRSLVYVAISGVTCAALLVEYSSDPVTVSSVQRMVENGVSLVVYTCDANVTRKLLSQIYNIPARLVTIMSTRSGSKYDRLTHVIMDKAPAILATNGTLSALANGITAAKRMRPLLVFSAIIQMVCYGLGLTLVALLCCIAGSSAVEPSQIMLLQTICLLATGVGIVYR